MTDRGAVRKVLETDRVWSAYALADLDPAHDDETVWHLAPDAVVLLYRGFRPPVLFAHGDPGQVRGLFHRIPAGEVEFGLMGSHRVLLEDRLHPRSERKVWRMVLKPEQYPGAGGEAERLTPDDLSAIEHLMDEHEDRPDAFSPVQLHDGTFYGIWQGDKLVSMAGTHVLSERMAVAAIGNVFTHPGHRGHGHGRATSAAVVEELMDRGLGTIVLNVAMDNRPALKLYESLGFFPFCGYYEGVGVLDPPPNDHQTRANGVSDVRTI